MSEWLSAPALMIAGLDCIHLKQIRAYGYTGYFPAEKTLGQWFEVDLWLYLDLRPAGASDRLADTVDYGAIVAAVQTFIRQQSYDLVETLAAAIAQHILSLDARLQVLDISLTKVAAPIPDFDGAIVITLRRSRADVRS